MIKTFKIDKEVSRKEFMKIENKEKKIDFSTPFKKYSFIDMEKNTITS